MKNRNITFTTVLLALGFLALSPIAQAVSPSAGRRLCGGNNTAEGKRTSKPYHRHRQHGLVGFQTLFHNNTGNSNTAEGFRALACRQHQSGDESQHGYRRQCPPQQYPGNFNNTANGVNPLNHNIDGLQQHGHRRAMPSSATPRAASTRPPATNALFSNTTGGGNTATGNNALFSNTTGGDNTAVGEVRCHLRATPLVSPAQHGHRLWARARQQHNRRRQHGHRLCCADKQHHRWRQHGCRRREPCHTKDRKHFGHRQHGCRSRAVASFANTTGGENTAVGASEPRRCHQHR